jgi:glycosyltransferase involved in cell wall biosynthesis
MRILIVVDKSGTAIDRLAQAVKKYSPHHGIEIFPVHPKRNDPDTIYGLGKFMDWADIIDIHYWKSGEIVRITNPSQFEAKPRVLFHFNPYDAENKEVNDRYNLVVVGNKTIYNKVPYAYLIQYGVDLDFFRFREDYTEDKVVNMSVARIEGKKGVKEVAQVCSELGYKFKLVGRVSKGGYMEEVMKAGKGIVEFLENATDEQLRDTYYQSAIHVCNSVDNFESGTLPILEAMACGVPVLTRNVGHVPDIYDGGNMVIREGNPENTEDLKKSLREMMENRAWRLKLRENAWDTVKNWDIRRMVSKVNRLYNQLYEPDKTLLSVIIPTKDRPEIFVQSFVRALGQDYKKFEVIVVDSGDTPVKPIIEEARKKTRVPVKYIHFPHKGNYTLAEARNRAVLEAEGEYLVFCDDRIKMDVDALSAFVIQARPKTWLWGMKDGVSKGFVENFSCVGRKDLIEGGMFCERMQWYGGMSQEIRERFEIGRGFAFIFLDKAKATGIAKAKSKRTRREDIIEAKWTLFKMYDKA